MSYCCQNTPLLHVRQEFPSLHVDRAGYRQDKYVLVYNVSVYPVKPSQH